MLQVASNVKERVHRNIGSVKVLVGRETFVEIRQVCIDTIGCRNIQDCLIGITVKCYGAARFYGEIPQYKVLKAEIICSFCNRIFAVHGYLIGFRVISKLHGAGAMSRNSVSCLGIHNEREFCRGSDRRPEVHGEYGWSSLLLFLMLPVILVFKSLLYRHAF